jgi:hypothetical protein
MPFKFEIDCIIENRENKKFRKIHGFRVLMDNALELKLSMPLKFEKGFWGLKHTLFSSA